MAPPGPQVPDPPPRPSLIALASGLLADAKALFGAELDLASAELRYNTGRLVLALAIVLAGGILLGGAGLALLAALIAALVPSLGPVGAALVTALTALVAGAALVIAGLSTLRRAPLAPRRAIANLTSYAESIRTPQEPKE